ncbi:MAG: prolipoprotein diacylglyceryl transferase [Parcubacteria group bacterium]|jgi:phosphatidylglycerol:prolipoprotein diacylglycerol transferase
MFSFYQHLPELVNPIAFLIGNFSVRWYSLMYLAGFCVVYGLLMYRVRKDERLSKIFNFQFSIFNKIPNTEYRIPYSIIIDFLLYSFIGLIAGGRLGYVLFYNLGWYIKNPLTIISPFDSSGNFIGIFGMSYFGGLIGIIIATIIFCRKNEINFWRWADFVVPAIPAGYFFGRIGNFLNGELYGKAANSFLGMYFGDGILRHPTQLYEALLEGLLLFVILWFLRNKTKFSGTLFLLYIAGYGMVRFFVEFLREPENDFIFGMTRGQVLAFFAIITAGIAYAYGAKKHSYKEI